MDEGYILSNKFRVAVFEGFATGETNINTIAKKHRMIPNVARKIAEDLVKTGYLKKRDNKYMLTRDGKRVASKII
jgi:predicted transcriptional regulator